jgi:O-succinylbenzoate synthase
VGGLAEAGYRRVKVKIGPGWDAEPLRALRAAFPGLALQADANGAYSPADAGRLGALDDLGLLLVEQPLPPGRLDDLAALAARLATPVCLDEDVVSAGAAEAALDGGACSVVCVKPGRVGGAEEARRVVAACQDRGAGCWVGGMVEAGLGKAVAVAVAALDGCTLPGDLPASARWFGEDGDLTEPWELDDGHLRVPTGPGLGVGPRPDVLRRATVASEWLRA